MIKGKRQMKEKKNKRRTKEKNLPQYLLQVHIRPIIPLAPTPQPILQCALDIDVHLHHWDYPMGLYI